MGTLLEDVTHLACFPSLHVVSVRIVLASRRMRKTNEFPREAMLCVLDCQICSRTSQTLSAPVHLPCLAACIPIAGLTTAPLGQSATVTAAAVLFQKVKEVPSSFVWNCNSPYRVLEDFILGVLTACRFLSASNS